MHFLKLLLKYFIVSELISSNISFFGTLRNFCINTLLNAMDSSLADFVERSGKYLYCSVADERRRVGKPWNSTFQRIQELLKSRSRSKVTASNVRQVEKLNSDFHHILPPSNLAKYQKRNKET